MRWRLKPLGAACIGFTIAASTLALTADRSTIRQDVTGSAPLPGSCRVMGLADPLCTPGAIDPRVTQANIHSTICVHGYTAKVRPPKAQTDAFKRTDRRAYSYKGPAELDHLIPLELGGSSDARNLWIEPGKIPNLKDRIEDQLHAQVCSGTLLLKDAQALIVKNWSMAS